MLDKLVKDFYLDALNAFIPDPESNILSRYLDTNDYIYFIDNLYVLLFFILIYAF